MSNVYVFFLTALAVIAFLGISYLVFSAVFYGICWGLAMTFTWQLSFGYWLIFLLFNGPAVAKHFK